MSLSTGIVGVTGYAGQELLRILLGHPRVKLTYLASSGKTDPGPVLRHFGRLPVPVEPFDATRCGYLCDAVLLSLPHKVAMESVPALLAAKVKVVDLSADFRLRDPKVYEAAYGLPHVAPALLKQAVYGIPELHGPACRKARLIASPGCYPTGATLALTPLLAKRLLTGRIIIDAKSGVTGAGRETKPDFMYAEVNENFRAYGIFKHRHAPEIAQSLDGAARKRVDFIFTPHLVPMNRGILSTIYATLAKPVDREAVVAVLKAAYLKAPFVRVQADGMPDTRGVRGTNFCDIGVAVRGRDLILVTAIDNLGKGAAGQAVQAFNLQHGFPETTGLLAPAGAP